MNDRYYAGKDICEAITELFECIGAMPAADVVEVVRCKDCNAYRKDKELARAKYFDEEQFCALLMCEMPENGFCWYGKRKGGEE